MSDNNNFFTEMKNTKPFLKVAFDGFAGTGKTFTAALLAVGLWKRIGSTRPIIIFDTERASKFLKPVFAAAGITALVKESRTLADLLTTMKLMREGAGDILMIDSITHVWEDVLAAFMREKNRKRLEIQDWGIIKPSWKSKFSDPFVNDQYHVIMSGRAGYSYDTEIDETTGKKQWFKSGVKMKVEGETAYEPDLLVYFERFEKILEGEKKDIWREATILKDRANLIDGKTFRNPTYEDFSPTIEAMLSDGVATQMDEKDTAPLFKEDFTRQDLRREKDIILDKILPGRGTSSLLEILYPGSSADSKQRRAIAYKEYFGTTSVTQLENMPLEALEQKFQPFEAFFDQEYQKQKESAEAENQ